MIRAFAGFALCQLIGEVVVRLARLPVPGPVVGLALLFVALLWRGRVTPSLRTASRGLLGHLSLLFVPAGAGVMLHVSRLRAEWLPLAASLVVGTALTLAVTAATFVAVARMTGDGGAAEPEA